MADAYQKIADLILSNIGIDGKWLPPWHQSGLTIPTNAVNGKHYQGVNILTCWVTARQRGYDHPLWATFKQWKEAGAQVRKGEKSTPIVFWKQLGDENTPREERRWVARGYWIFNRAQVDNAPELPEPPPALPVVERLVEVDRMLACIQTRARIEEIDGVGAYYDRLADKVVLPPYERFKNVEGYYGTVFHELSHWTGHASRLDRQFGKRFGDNAYALEELVAELSAVFLSCDRGIRAEPRPDHALYIKNWFTVLKEDPAAFATAVAHARKAATMLTELGEAPALETAA